MMPLFLWYNFHVSILPGHFVVIEFGSVCKRRPVIETKSVNVRPAEWKRWGPLRFFHRVNLKYLRVKPQLMVLHISPCEAVPHWCCFIHCDVTVEMEKRAATLPPSGSFLLVLLYSVDADGWILLFYSCIYNCMKIRCFNFRLFLTLML